jgi:hypothetical protein
MPRRNGYSHTCTIEAVLNTWLEPDGHLIDLSPGHRFRAQWTSEADAVAADGPRSTATRPDANDRLAANASR